MEVLSNGLAYCRVRTCSNCFDPAPCLHSICLILVIVDLACSLPGIVTYVSKLLCVFYIYVKGWMVLHTKREFKYNF